MALAENLDYYTVEDIYALPDGQRAELIDGEIYMMATPGRIHQELVMELSFRIKRLYKAAKWQVQGLSSPVCSIS